MPDTSSSPERREFDELGDAIEGRGQHLPLATATFMARSAYRRLVGLNEERA